jgi:two-component system response regulator DesR
MDGTTVLFVEHDARVMNELTTAVSQYPDLELAGCLMGTRALAGAIASRRPDVAVVDIDDPNVPEEEILAEIRRAATRQPETRTIVVTGRGDPSVRAKAVANGALGFVHKEAGRGVLLETVRTVAEGKYAVLRHPGQVG